MTRHWRVDVWTWVLGLGALGNVANGLWMLADPAGWFFGIPAAVPDSGPLNEHFVRDIGSVYAMLGIGMLWAAVVPAVRVTMMSMVTLFYALHALVHVYDSARGLFPPAHWAIDFPAIYLPAVFVAVLTALLARRAKATA